MTYNLQKVIIHLSPSFKNNGEQNLCGTNLKREKRSSKRSCMDLAVKHELHLKHTDREASLEGKSFPEYHYQKKKKKKRTLHLQI